MQEQEKERMLEALIQHMPSRKVGDVKPEIEQLDALDNFSILGDSAIETAAKALGVEVDELKRKISSTSILENR